MAVHWAVGHLNEEDITCMNENAVLWCLHILCLWIFSCFLCVSLEYLYLFCRVLSPLMFPFLLPPIPPFSLTPPPSFSRTYQLRITAAWGLLLCRLNVVIHEAQGCRERACEWAHAQLSAEDRMFLVASLWQEQQFMTAAPFHTAFPSPPTACHRDHHHRSMSFRGEGGTAEPMVRSWDAHSGKQQLEEGGRGDKRAWVGGESLASSEDIQYSHVLIQKKMPSAERRSERGEGYIKRSL